MNHHHSTSYNHPSSRSKPPNRNHPYPMNTSYREQDEDEYEEDDELAEQNDGFNDQEDEEEDEDEEEAYQNGYDNDSRRRQKKRRLESLVSKYEFAPRAGVNLPPKPAAFARDLPVEWTDQDSSVLLEVWGDRFLQLGRRSLRSEDWYEVAEKVSELRKVETSHTQCRNRLDALKNKYRKEKAKADEMGGYYGKWVFFKKMDMLLNSSPRQQYGLACGVESGEFVFMNPRVYLNQSNALDEMRDSPGESESDGDDSDGQREEDDGSSFRLLADSIQKFGKIYEKIEDSKRQQMTELESMRMDFQRELELQKKQILERAQAEIAKIRQGDEDDTDVSAENLSV